MSAHEGFLGESLSEGEVSKDVWVLATAPVKSVTLLKPTRAAIQLRRSGNDLPSRAADNLYWLGRFVERAERMVRHLRTRHRAAHEPTSPPSARSRSPP